MVTKQELCKKIAEIVPNAGVCGIDLDVEYNERIESWAVIMHQGQSRIRTYIKADTITNCLEGKSCDPLGLKIARLRHIDSPFS